MAKKKFDTFGDFVMKDDKVVMKTLIVTSMWAGNISFSLIVLTMYFLKVWELFIILGLISLFGWYKVYQFYQMGGTKAMPAMTAEQTVWRRNLDGKEKEGSKEESEKGQH